MTPPKAKSKPSGEKLTAKHSKETPKQPVCKKINLALQGGGAQGAFTWGVLDRLLAEPGIEIDAMTGTSAGAVNGVVMAYGMLRGGREDARQLLHDLWRKVSRSTANPLLPSGTTSFFDKMFSSAGFGSSPSSVALDYMTRILSPYQFNLFDINPLRDIIDELVDFEAIRKSSKIRLFVNATNVRTGKIKVFDTKEMTLDMVLASACLPFIFKTVEIDGEPYWDGGYSGNPAIYPLIYKAGCLDVVIVQINPLYVEDVPRSAAGILDRVNEISFNSNLMREMRAIAFVTKLIDDGHLTNDEYKKMHVHMIEAQEITTGLGYASKMNTDWDFLTHLRDIGIQAASDWLKTNYDKIGVDSSIDIRKMFL